MKDKPRLRDVEYPAGTLLVVVGALGFPSIARLGDDGRWRYEAGLFRGRNAHGGEWVMHVCAEGDVFTDVGVAVRGGVLVPIQEATS